MDNATKVKAEEPELIPDFAKPEIQEARAFLRERFLTFINGIVSKDAKFNLYENSKVSGEFRGTDVDCLELYVKNLSTPLGKIPQAVLRATDVITFEIENLKDE
ncbi:hypothetical protein HCN44_000136 [Aphidius gifuensis]|uniref:Uncharacterized protein n=1 Tax=Aphidius gifuensis TaxID=684658 RepID=A0A834XT56_APHGI|nr:gem-associated protein 7-like [Aphidius gifuensis]KAF7990331.1 hypothetical protein HCN44_000136 [Aphidius gifuensis]